MYRKKGRGWTKHIDFMLIDIACIVIAFFISYVIRFGFNNPYVDKDYRILGVAFLLIDFFVEIMADSFKNVLKRGYLDEFISTCKHAMLLFLVTALFLFTTQMADIYSRLSFYIMFPIYVTITYVARIALKSLLKKKSLGASKKSLLVIAPDAILRDTLRTVEKSCIGYTKIVAASLDTDMKGETICGIPIVANHDGIVDYACDEWVDEVLIPPCSEDEYPEKMADIFLEMGIAVHTGIAKNGTAQGGYKQIEKIGDYTVVTSSVNYANHSALLVKRGMDIVGGLVGCLFTLIIMIFVGPMIYIASPGPIFFSQERIGRNGRKFKMYKFRSMYMDAEERKKELMAQNKVGDGMMFKMDFDPRIIGNKVLPNGKKKTGIGQFIRKTSLDEFPQFFNILVGDMSLVGTRPPTLDEWEKYEPHHRARMSFRPGLTGLWQVSGRSNITDFEEVVKLDTQYIGEWSVKMDIVDETEVKDKFVTSVVFWDAILTMILSGILCLIGMIGAGVVAAASKSGSLAGVCYFFIVVGLTGIIMRFPKIFMLGSPLKRLKAFGNGIRKALEEQRLLEETHCKVVAESLGPDHHIIYLSGGSGRDKALFAQCVNEFFDVIDNQRYILVKRKNRKGLNGFYAIPNCFSKKKEDAERFAKCMHPYIGNYDCIYTRNEKGRELLLEGRVKALANREERCISHKKVKGALE